MIFFTINHHECVGTVFEKGKLESPGFSSDKRSCYTWDSLLEIEKWYFIFVMVLCILVEEGYVVVLSSLVLLDIYGGLVEAYVRKVYNQ